MKVANVVIGNSSSGIIEAPSIGTPTINIGDRQKGRLKAWLRLAVIVNMTRSILQLSYLLVKSSKDFKKKESPYGNPELLKDYKYTL